MNDILLYCLIGTNLVMNILFSVFLGLIAYGVYKRKKQSKSIKE